MITVAIKRHPDVNTHGLTEALRVQARDLDAAWGCGVPRIVEYTTRKPTGAWRIQFYDELPAGMGGVHLNTKDGHPYAKVLTSEGTVAASHEFCEMLVDPIGERFITVGKRDYLVEVCDPCEAIAYMVGHIDLSDFVTPAWYEAGQTYDGDFLNHVMRRHLALGGYVSWIENDYWWQAFMDFTGRVTSQLLGQAFERTRFEKDRLAAADLALRA